MRMMKRTTYVVETLLCVLVIALVIMAVKSFVLVPVSSHDYPYVNKGVFRPETFNSYMRDTPPVQAAVTRQVRLRYAAT